jgi:uncharacterized membrane protein
MPAFAGARWGVVLGVAPGGAVDGILLHHMLLSCHTSSLVPDMTGLQEVPCS